MSATRIVSFLGLPGYTPVVYKLGDVLTRKTPIKDVATVQAAQGAPVFLYVVGTKQVGRQWFGDGNLYANELNCGLPRDVWPDRLEFVQIKNGDTPEELQEIFEQVIELLRPGTLEGESAPPDRIIVDITNGWRSQSFFASSAVAFMRSEQRRQMHRAELSQENAPIYTISYAAYDARDRETEIAPVWDLTSFLEAGDWDAAIQGLMRYGRADDLAHMLGTLQGRLARSRKKNDPFPKLQPFGKVARHFADALATARIDDILTEVAPGLEEGIAQAGPDLQRHVPAVKEQLETLLAWSRIIQANTTISTDGIAAAMRLAELYVQLERFSEATALIRETLVSAWSVRKRGAAALQPNGNSSFSTERDEDESELKAHSFRAESKDPLAKAFQATMNLRNDVQHCGFRREPASPSKVRSQLNARLRQALAAIEEPGSAPEPGTTFINCSDRPVSAWSESQLSAAEEFELGAPIDVPGGLLDLPPETDEKTLAARVERLTNDIVALNPGVVFVSGDATMTYSLVNRLRRQGVVCVGATSNSTLSGGECIPEFVRWRRYQ